MLLPNPTSLTKLLYEIKWFSWNTVKDKFKMRISSYKHLLMWWIISPFIKLGCTCKHASTLAYLSNRVHYQIASQWEVKANYVLGSVFAALK